MIFLWIAQSKVYRVTWSTRYGMAILASGKSLRWAVALNLHGRGAKSSVFTRTQVIF